MDCYPWLPYLLTDYGEFQYFVQPGAVKGRILCLGAERKIARIFYVLRPVCIKLGTGYAQEALLSDYEFRENRMIACSNFLGGGGRKSISMRACNACPIWA